MRSRVLASASGAVVLLVGALAVAVWRAQDEPPAWWFLVGLVVCFAGTVYAVAKAPGHRTVLMVTSILAGVLGLLGLLTIGLPLLLASALGLAATTERSSVPTQ